MVAIFGEIRGKGAKNARRTNRGAKKRGEKREKNRGTKKEGVTQIIAVKKRGNHEGEKREKIAVKKRWDNAKESVAPKRGEK